MTPMVPSFLQLPVGNPRILCVDLETPQILLAGNANEHAPLFSSFHTSRKYPKTHTFH